VAIVADLARECRVARRLRTGIAEADHPLAWLPGPDPAGIPGWIEEGRRRRDAARMPFPGGLR
jgi:hypothetical protein